MKKVTPNKIFCSKHSITLTVRGGHKAWWQRNNFRGTPYFSSNVHIRTTPTIYQNHTINNTPCTGTITVHFPLQKSDRGFADRLQKAHFIARILISCREICFLSLWSKVGNCRRGVQMGVSGVKSVSLHVGFWCDVRDGRTKDAHTVRWNQKRKKRGYAISVKMLSRRS